MKLAVFTDFDGTISKRDVGYSLFHHFSDGKNDLFLPQWKSGEMSSRECLVKEAELVSASPEELYAFVDSIGIDEHFHEFVKRCETENIPLTVISDGLDFYIKHLLSKHALSHLPLKTNPAFLENNTIRIEFPHQNKKCTYCGICKGEAIEEYREKYPNTCIIYIGDGYSDSCAAPVADILFAKKDLAVYCDSKNISYNRYETFEDVINTLVTKQLLSA